MPLYPQTNVAPSALATGKYVRKTRTAGSIVFSSTTWSDVDTATDITLTASVGKVVLIGLAGLFNNEAAAADLDVATIVSGSPVHYVSGGTGATTDRGILGWSGPSSNYANIGVPLPYAIQSGDVSSGTVTLRLRGHYFSGTSKTLFATTALPLAFWAWCIS